MSRGWAVTEKRYVGLRLRVSRRGCGTDVWPYCRGLTLDGFGIEASQSGSYVCSLDGRHLLVCFLVKKQRPCPVFKLQPAVGSTLEGNYSLQLALHLREITACNWLYT